MNFIKTLEKLNISTELISDYKMVHGEPDAIILFKGLGENANYLKRQFPNSKIGLLNPDLLEKKHDDVDFVLVNSIEEKVSLLMFYKNIFVINLIEKSYLNQKQKIHKESKYLTIGYHGSSSHLKRLEDGFVQAVNFLITEKSFNFKLKVITENNNFAQSVISDLGLNINSIDFNNWSVKNIVKFMNSIDIGVVPNNKILENKFDDFNNGLYFSDYTLRFKNKSNPGRAFVYIQFGIPVIADLTPSMLPLYFDEKCGYIANNKESYIYALRKLGSVTERAEKAKNAIARFNDLYSIEEDALNIINYISRN